MTPSRRNALVEEALADEPDAAAALAATLLATRQAAGRRRQNRRRTRALAALALLACGAWAAIRLHPHHAASPAIAQPAEPAEPHVIERAAAPAAFIPVRTRPEWAPISVATTAAPASIVTTSSATHTVVSTRPERPEFTPASETDLFAAAGNRPAALQRLRDGSARWVWLDQRPPRR